VLSKAELFLKKRWNWRCRKYLESFL